MTPHKELIRNTVAVCDCLWPTASVLLYIKPILIEFFLHQNCFHIIISFVSFLTLIDIGHLNSQSEQSDANDKLLVLDFTNLIINQYTIKWHWKLCVWRSGRKPASQQQEDVSLQEGVASECGGVVFAEGVALKELKDVEGTGLNALWPIRWHIQSRTGAQPTRWQKSLMNIKWVTCESLSLLFSLKNVFYWEKTWIL